VTRETAELLETAERSDDPDWHRRALGARGRERGVAGPQSRLNQATNKRNQTPAVQVVGPGRSASNGATETPSTGSRSKGVPAGLHRDESVVASHAVALGCSHECGGEAPLTARRGAKRRRALLYGHGPRGRSSAACPLFAVVCRVASRNSRALAASWRRRGVRVFVEDPHEARRVAKALGCSVEDLNIAVVRSQRYAAVGTEVESLTVRLGRRCRSSQSRAALTLNGRFRRREVLAGPATNTRGRMRPYAKSHSATRHPSGPAAVP
jgi:hypothetical protein